MAEAHPVGFQWVMEAKRRGATIIHVDPRFTRTSAVADLHVPIRAGSDIAFLGGLVNHVLSNDLDFREYVVAYTNAANIIDEDFQDTEDLDGLFSGFDPETGQYDPVTWRYEPPEDPNEEEQERIEEFERDERGGGSHGESHEAAQSEAHGSGGAPVSWKGRRDETLQHPRCVFQILKRHFARYTPEMVQEVCGIEPEQFRQVAEALTRNSGRERTTALCYAVGWTHHSVGAQMIRTAAILQLLLGNIGRPGGGILALRGHASIQGSTDIPTLFNILPGYLPMPHADQHQEPGRLGARRRGQGRLLGQHPLLQRQPAQGLLGRRGDGRERLLLRLPAARHRRPLDVHHGQGPDRGPQQGLLPGGREPRGRLGQRQDAAARAGQPRLARRARPADDRVGDVLEGRPGDRDRRAGHRGDRHRGLLPARGHRTSRRPARSPRPSGCCSGATRPSTRRATAAASWTSTTSSAPDPREAGRVDRRDGPAAARPGLGLPDRRARRGGRRRGAARDQRHRPRRHGAVGLHRAEGRRLDLVRLLDLLRRVRRRGQPGPSPQAALGAGPGRRRVGLGLAGQPARSSTTARRPPPTARRGASARRTSGGTPTQGKWTGPDVPDFVADRAPDHVPADGAKGPDAIGGQDPFVMQTDGKGWLFAPLGLADGPMPTHYEPPESPVHNPLYAQQNNPGRRKLDHPQQPDQPELERGLPVRVHDATG